MTGDGDVFASGPRWAGHVMRVVATAAMQVVFADAWWAEQARRASAGLQDSNEACDLVGLQAVLDMVCGDGLRQPFAPSRPGGGHPRALRAAVPPVAPPPR